MPPGLPVTRPPLADHHSHRESRDPGHLLASVLLLDVWKRLRSANMRAISRFFVSENCVAMTTRHRLMRKNAPICSQPAVTTASVRRASFMRTA